ncbi:hypothetical protein [Acidithiobacillus thiooxidans]|uniref:hypothetical protein n=1 Tax=Acidithiobacillus thiooxidans TaxID=930 RepID=UPI001111FBF8|nr:hypothetical protein [Acidithiobacillus thiooxidans]
MLETPGLLIRWSGSKQHEQKWQLSIRVNGHVARLDLSALYFFEPGAWHDVPADGGILGGTVVVDRGDRLGADAL